MSKKLMAANIAVTCLFVATGSVMAEEYTTTTYDPVLEAYRYTAPANSWYAAKVKPKLKMQSAAKVPATVEPVSIPDVVSDPAPVANSGAATSPPVLDGSIANSPVAKSPEPTRALPFWQDIQPVDGQKAQ